MPELRVRAGVLTGNAAVELGAEGEGMVLGDTVNTASRLQSIADAGHGAGRRRHPARDRGSDRLRGRGRARGQGTRAAGARLDGAARRGRRRRRAARRRTRGAVRGPRARAAHGHRIVRGERRAATRPPGHRGRRGWARASRGCCGSSSSTSDGVERVVRWHQGRCLSYGEGVAYWALAEMVRARAGIAEEEDPDSARAKAAREAVEQYVTDERERRLVEPRLAHLLGLEQRTASDRADLFSGWRLFFERMSEEAPGGARVRGSPVGRLAGCSSSSTTCSSGRPSARCSCSRSAGRSCSTPDPAWAAEAISLGAAARRRDARAARRTRAGSARGAGRAGPVARRGRAAVRRRDGPDAARPRPARARRAAATG